MHVYKNFLKISKKNIGVTITYFVIFIAIMILMTFIESENYPTAFEKKSVKIAILDKDNTETSKALKDYLSKENELITLRSYDYESIQDSLFFDKIKYYLEIPEGFEKDFIETGKENILYNAKQENNADAYFVEQQIQSYISSLSLYIAANYDIDQAIEATNSDFTKLPAVELLKSEENLTAKSTNQHIYFFFQYVPYISIVILIFGMAPTLLVFRQNNLGHRINCSSFSSRNKNIQLALGCSTYSLALCFILLFAAAIIYGPNKIFSLNGILCTINLFVFIAIATSIALLLTNFSLNKNSLNIVTNIIALPMCFLCGIFIPQFYLSKAVLAFSKFLPAYWYIKNNNMLGSLANEPFTYSSYITNILIQLVFFIAIMSVFFLLSKQKKQNAM